MLTFYKSKTKQGNILDSCLVVTGKLFREPTVFGVDNYEKVDISLGEAYKLGFRYIGDPQRVNSFVSIAVLYQSIIMMDIDKPLVFQHWRPFLAEAVLNECLRTFSQYPLNIDFVRTDGPNSSDHPTYVIKYKGSVK